MEVSNQFNVPAAAQAKKYFNLLKSKPEQKGGGKRKKGGTRHKNLGKKINELQISIDLLSKGNGRIERKLYDIRQDINDAYANIQSNEQSIGTISSYINYKLDETHEPSNNESIKPPLEKWTQHLNSIYNGRDRNAHDEQILRNAEMLGGRRNKTRKRRRKKTKRKRRKNKKTRRKKSRR